MARRYFDEEMRYLHEAGKVFAEIHPEQARMLNIDSVTDRDPYVERLFEGFAFLTGRIRERLDDEMPEYTESLCRQLYPQYLYPIPALSLVAFKPRPGSVQDTTIMPRGTEVVSDPVGEQRTECIFRTTQPVRLQPLRLSEVAMNWQSDGTSSAVLSFSVEGNTKLGDLQLDPLRIYFHTDPSRASIMHLFFTRHVRKMEIRPEGAPPVTIFGQKGVQPGGVNEEDGLLPYSDHTFSGFKILQEYLVYRRKFWCVDLHGLDEMVAGAATRFEVEVFFDRSFPEDRRFRVEDMRLYCSPVVNLFERDAEPIRVDHRVPEYRVVPSVSKQMEVYDVLHGVGTEEKTGRRHEYLPFFSFKHGRKKELRYFTTSARFGPTGRFGMMVNVNPLDQSTDDLASETLSLDLLCTNGSLPREKLQEGMINKLAEGTSTVARPTNLTQPTLILYPPIRQQKQFFWKFISHWSLNYQTIASREGLQGVLELYDWTTNEANNRRIAGIQTVSWKPKELVSRGMVRRGVEVIIQVQEDHFADEGDVALFGFVMSRFLASYATINSFVHLTVEALLSGKSYQWKPENGAQPIL